MIPSVNRAFISYSRRHHGWVEVLHSNLERCTGLEIFLDTQDLGSGRSWPTGLEQGLDRATHLILVVTPEALASRWVLREVNGFLADGKLRLHVVKLIETPLPSFQKQIEHVDFVDHDAEKYRQGLRKLVAGLRGSAVDELEGIEFPTPPRPSLPAVLRGEPSKGATRFVVLCLQQLRPEPLPERDIGTSVGRKFLELFSPPPKNGGSFAVSL